MTPKIVYIEGNIGIGKSTLLSNLDKEDLKKKYNYKVFYEPVDNWIEVGILDKFYEDPAKYCYLFQSYCLFTRFNILKKIDKSNLDFVFIERSIFTDKYVFAKSCKELGTMSDIEFDIYDKWFTHYLNCHPNDYMFIHLTLEPETCLQRIKKRSRNAETSISLDYLKLLDKNEKEWINGVDSKVLRYDCKKYLDINRVLEDLTNY
jgi:deoxyadenosine/deoxycytidine kinase